jgi:hypothetical protein
MVSGVFIAARGLRRAFARMFRATRPKSSRLASYSWMYRLAQAA